MDRALFYIAKRAWYKEQRAKDLEYNRSRPEPPSDPVPGQGWFADPHTLKIQLDPFKTPIHEGSSVKIDRQSVDISRAFRPRPFLIISNEVLLAQKRAWICPLSTSAYPPVPEWVVPLPELRTSALTSKIHTIDTEFFPDVAERDLLRTMENRDIKSSILSEESQRKVRVAIEKYLSGAFAPKDDRLPPGSIVRSSNGIERVVLASCYLGNYYRGAGTLSTICRLIRTPLPKTAHAATPGLVPLPGSPAISKSGEVKPSAPQGYLDLGRVASEMQDSLVSTSTGRQISILPEAYKALGGLLLGGLAEEKNE